MRHIELLQAHHPSNCVGQWTQQLVEAHIEDCQILQQPNLTRQTRSKPIVHHYNLVQIRHVPEARRDAAMELVVSKNDDRHRRVPEIVWQIEDEAVVVDKYCVQRLVEQLSGYSPFKLIEPQIQELERWKPEDNFWELPSKAIVTEIQLKQQLQVLEFVGHSSTEPVRVYVKQC